MITSILILLLPLDYIEGQYTNYSMGPKVYALLASVPIFFVVSIISITLPESLFVLVYIILTAVGLLMSSENSEKYLDKQTGMFNQYALGIVCSEYIAQNTGAYATVISLGETEHIHTAIDWRYYVTILGQLQNYCRKEYHNQLYRVGDNGFVLLTTQKQNAGKIASDIVSYAQAHSDNKLTAEYETIYLRDCVSSDELMSQIIDICIHAINKSASYDFLTGVHNRNSFERYLSKYKEKAIDAYYFIIDVNNLKETNDVIGHSAGDELLQSVASLLADTVKADGIVFRQGGDEFSILLNTTDPLEFLTRLENNRKKINQTRHNPISFAIGYAKVLDNDGLENADTMMYQNKARMKAQRL